MTFMLFWHKLHNCYDWEYDILVLALKDKEWHQYAKNVDIKLELLPESEMYAFMKNVRIGILWKDMNKMS